MFLRTSILFNTALTLPFPVVKDEHTIFFSDLVSVLTDYGFCSSFTCRKQCKMLPASICCKPGHASVFVYTCGCTKRKNISGHSKIITWAMLWRPRWWTHLPTRGGGTVISTWNQGKKMLRECKEKLLSILTSEGKTSLLRQFFFFLLHYTLMKNKLEWVSNTLYGRVEESALCNCPCPSVWCSDIHNDVLQAAELTYHLVRYHLLSLVNMLPQFAGGSAFSQGKWACLLSPLHPLAQYLNMDAFVWAHIDLSS